MKKIMFSVFASLLVLISANTAQTVAATTTEVKNEITSPKWKAEGNIIAPQWFKERGLNEKANAIASTRKEYNLVHNNGKGLSKSDISLLTNGSIEVLPDENNREAYLVAVGSYIVNGQKQTDYYFSNINNTPINDIRKYAIEEATEEYNQTNGFETTESTVGIQALAASSYTDNYHWIIYSDQEKYSNGTYVVAGFIDSSVSYTKEGTTIINGQRVSVWDVKASNQSKPQNGYQTRQIASRHTVEPYVPDQKLLSYGPTTTTAGSNFSVSLSGGLPTVSWNFSRESVDVIDNSSLSSGYGKWTFDFALGTASAKGSFLMEPGIRVSNASGMVKFQHSHQGNFYKNLSYQGVGVSGLVVSQFNDL